MQAILTYEKLFDFLREERNNVQLQKLPESFYADVIEYLSVKESSIDSLKQSNSLTFENALIQLKNAKKIIESIYERREKKILNLALNKSRTRSVLIDTSALLKEEKQLFKQLCIVLDHFRGELLTNLLNKSIPIITDEKDSIEKFELEVGENTDNSVDSEDSFENKTDLLEPDQEIVSIKFTQFVDKFVGPNLDILGPFEEGDVVKLPLNVVEVVISKGYANRI